MNNSLISTLNCREATLDDLDALVAIETQCFAHDRISRRSFRHWLKASHGNLIVIEREQVLGYGLIWCHKGTRLARLYSIALIPELRGSGAAQQLLCALEQAAINRNRMFMRLEVAKNNSHAIRLYEKCGYRIFGEYCDYYQDHSDALRMQKTIQRIKNDTLLQTTPWYQQTTGFTCGPAALMMAMASLNNNISVNQPEELAIWREATTIFMTSGHGGCHPFGLALAAQRRGYSADVIVNSEEPLFVEGVRTSHKKSVLNVVHQQFVEQIHTQSDISIRYKELEQHDLSQWLEQGFAIIILISTYRLDGKKAPHWVTITGCDERCFYVHDPDPGELNQLAIDSQYLPLAREDLAKMSTFGSGRLRTAVAIKWLASSKI